MSKEVKELSKDEEWEKNKKGCFIGIGVIVLCFVGGGIVGYFDDTPKVKINPCDCYSVFDKKEKLGWSNLSQPTKEEYNTCVDKWDNKFKANNGCLEKMGIE